jgi:spore coat protein A, manganese oxidase
MNCVEGEDTLGSLTRRDLLRGAGVGLGLLGFVRRGFGFVQSPALRKFIQPLPGLGPAGIPVATPKTVGGVDTYRLELGAFTQSLHPDLPPSHFWGYADVTNGATPNHRYLGGVIVARRGRPVQITAINKLPPTHPLPVDTTLMGAEPGVPENRAVIHLHGGLVPWTSDGGPFGWFTPDGRHGPDFRNPGGNPGEAVYYYPNDQSARLMWYHDHALGITRLNAYAGLASAYIIRDDFEDGLVRAGLIPTREVPLVIQDKTFVPSTGTDPGGRGNPGDLWYPSVYDPLRWERFPGNGNGDIQPLPGSSCVPEFFSDTIVINGAVWPSVSLEPRHYRFRILNGSQARFYNLQLYYADASGVDADLTKPGPRFVQIGTEGGFLPFPTVLNNPPRQIGFDIDPNSPTCGNATSYTLLLAPAERADVIIDFSNVPAGSRLILYNDAPAPFPGGDPSNDYPPTDSSGGPDTRALMQIGIIPRNGPADPSSLSLLESVAVNGAGIANAISGALLPAITRFDRRQAAAVRDLTLNEDFDGYGRLIQMLGTNVSLGKNNEGDVTFSRAYMDDPTETPKAGAVEIWRIFNRTGDTHPIHFHLVNVQVLSRQPFDADNYNGTPVFLGPARPPDANERGWKETVRMNPNECTTVAMKFDLAKVPFDVPLSTRTGVRGHEFVWHCHILEHEEHDMMRPLIIRP